MTARREFLRREGTTRDGRKFTIRPTSPRDAPGIVALQDAVAAEGGLIAATPGDRSAFEEEMLLSRIVAVGGVSLTLEVDGELSGRLLVNRRVERDQAHIGDVAIIVANTSRGLGLGRALMEMAIEWARAVRLEQLGLAVFITNVRAISLYRSLGFVDEQVLPKRVRLPDGDRDVLLMGLRLR